MCVILVGKIGRKLHEQAKYQNPQGFSLFTAQQGLVKAPTEEQVRQAVNEWGIWHYRIASSGGVSKDNIHPFSVANGKAYLYHNGVIGAGTATKSDTRCLAELLKESPIKTVESVLESLSSSNRFLLVSADNPRNFRLFGKWECEAGVLMSHKMYDYSYYRTLNTSQKAGWSLADAPTKTYIQDEEYGYDSELDEYYDLIGTKK